MSAPDSQPQAVIPPDLLAQAQAFDAGAVAPAAAPGQGGALAPAATAESVAKDISGLLLLSVGMLSPLFPRLSAVWTDAECARVAQAAAPVLIKHGWVPDFGKWGEEIMLAVTLAPLAVPTMNALKLQKQEAKQNAQQKTEGASGGAPAGNAPQFIQPATTASAADQ